MVKRREKGPSCWARRRSPSSRTAGSSASRLATRCSPRTRTPTLAASGAAWASSTSPWHAISPPSTCSSKTHFAGIEKVDSFIVVLPVAKVFIANVFYLVVVLILHLLSLLFVLISWRKRMERVIRIRFWGFWRFEIESLGEQVSVLKDGLTYWFLVGGGDFVLFYWFCCPHILRPALEVSPRWMN